MFTKGKSPEVPQPPVPRPAALPEMPKRAAMPGARASVPSIISNDVTIRGSVVSQGEVQVDGTIEGDVRATTLTIGDTGAVTGEILAESVVVRGSVNGRIRGRKVQLCTGSKVRGDIFHTSLAIEANSVFEGQVKHSQDPLSSEAAPAMRPPEPAPQPAPPVNEEPSLT